MSLSLVIPCSTPDIDYFFEWFTPFALNNHYDCSSLVILNGHCIPKYYKELKLKSVSIVSIASPLFPGQARNIALDYINDGHLAFIDARTIVSSEWLQFAQDFHLNYSDASCLGSVLYYASKPWHLPLIASTYGFNKLSCLPGSIIHRKAFTRAGYFLPNVRAGEDIDWIWRACKHEIFLDVGMPPPLKYCLDPDRDFLYYLRKWFRNYSCTSALPYISDSQRTFYAFFLFLSITFISYVWNSLFANWDELSPFYIPYISRSVVSIFIFLYLLLRCIYLPLKKGITTMDLAKNFFFIVLISIGLDIVKLMAFIPSILRKLRSFSK